MGNRRIILILLGGILACALLLWGVQRRGRMFPVESKAKTVLLEHALDGVESVTVERGDARIGLRRQGGRWTMVAPFPAQVDQGTVQRLLDTFEKSRVSDAHLFQELRKRELSLKEFGLAPAQAHVVLEGPRHRDEFLFGAFTPLGAEVYVRMNAIDQVLVLPASLYAAVPRTADDLRSRKLTHCDRALLRTVEVRAPGKPFIKLSKEAGTWRLVQPAPAPASDAQVEALLDVLYEARVSQFVWPTVSNVMDVAETESAFKARMSVYGFGADSAVQVQLQESGAIAPAKIAFGHPLEEAEGLTYVLLQGGDAIGAVSNEVVDVFRLTPAELHDTRLFYEVPSHVKRFQVYFGDALFVLTQTNDVWRMESPLADVADQSVVRDTVERLLRLNAVSVDSDLGGESRRVQNEQNLPISHVELFAEGGSSLFSIAPDDIEGRFLRVSFTNSPTVFRVASSNVPPALVSMLGLLELRDKTVLALPAKSLRRISVKRGAGAAETVERAKDGAVWRLGEGMSGQVSAPRVSALVALAEGLRADRIEKLGVALADLDAYGLGAPWLELSVDVDAADAVRKTLLVGKEAGFGKRFAMVRGLDVLFVLDAESLKTLSERLVEPL